MTNQDRKEIVSVIILNERLVIDVGFVGHMPPVFIISNKTAIITKLHRKPIHQSFLSFIIWNSPEDIIGAFKVVVLINHNFIE